MNLYKAAYLLDDNILLESRDSDARKKAINWIIEYMNNQGDGENYDEFSGQTGIYGTAAAVPLSKAKFLMKQLEDEFTAVMRRQTYSKAFLKGLARIAIQECGYGTNNKNIQKLNYLKKLYMTACILFRDKPTEYQYNVDFNGMSYRQLYSLFAPKYKECAKKLSEELGTSIALSNNDIDNNAVVATDDDNESAFIPEISTTGPYRNLPNPYMVNAFKIGNYNAVRIDTFEQSKTWNKFTNKTSEWAGCNWCITDEEMHWDSYHCGIERIVYFLYKDNFRDLNIYDYNDDECPDNEWGRSLLCVMVGLNQEGEWSFVQMTSRYNHCDGHGVEQIGDRYGDFFVPKGDAVAAAAIIGCSVAEMKSKLPFSSTDNTSISDNKIFSAYNKTFEMTPIPPESDSQKIETFNHFNINEIHIYKNDDFSAIIYNDKVKIIFNDKIVTNDWLPKAYIIFFKVLNTANNKFLIINIPQALPSSYADVINSNGESIFNNKNVKEIKYLQGIDNIKVYIAKNDGSLFANIYSLKINKFLFNTTRFVDIVILDNYSKNFKATIEINGHRTGVLCDKYGKTIDNFDNSQYQLNFTGLNLCMIADNNDNETRYHLCNYSDIKQPLIKFKYFPDNVFSSTLKYMNFIVLNDTTKYYFIDKDGRLIKTFDTNTKIFKGDNNDKPIILTKNNNVIEYINDNGEVIGRIPINKLSNHLKTHIDELAPMNNIYYNFYQNKLQYISLLNNEIIYETTNLNNIIKSFNSSYNYNLKNIKKLINVKNNTEIHYEELKTLQFNENGKLQNIYLVLEQTQDESEINVYNNSLKRIKTICNNGTVSKLNGIVLRHIINGYFLLKDPNTERYQIKIIDSNFNSIFTFDNNNLANIKLNHINDNISILSYQINNMQKKLYINKFGDISDKLEKIELDERFMSKKQLRNKMYTVLLEKAAYLC